MRTRYWQARAVGAVLRQAAMIPSRFISFEGGDGAGKSTQVGRLAGRLRRDAGIDVVCTREPGGTPFAEKVRDLLLASHEDGGTAEAEALLFYAARADHLARVIRPALAAGKWVLCDRFADSTHAYQGAASSADDAFLTGLDRLVLGTSVPDLTILLDLPVAVSFARAHERAQVLADTKAKAHAHAPQGSGEITPDRFEAEDENFHQRLRDGFLAIAKREPERVRVVDATQTVDAVSDVVWQIVSETLLT